MGQVNTLILPLLLWAYVLCGPEQPASMTFVLYAGLAVLAAVTAVLGVNFKAAVIKCRDMIEDGEPPHQLWRLFSGMLAVAACIDIGWPAMAVVIGYVGLTEVVFEMAARPMGEGDE